MYLKSEFDLIQPYVRNFKNKFYLKIQYVWNYKNKKINNDDKSINNKRKWTRNGYTEFN